MKKHILLFAVMACLAFSAAAKKNVYMDYYKKGHADKSTTVHRSSMHLSIEVSYDEELNQVEVSAPYDMEAQVYLCDGDGNILGSSATLNTILSVPVGYNGVLVVRVEGEDWIGSGEMPV